MGYSFNSLSRILDQKSLFKGKRIVTLGTLYPFLEKNEVQILAKRGLRFDVPKELFSKHLFVDVLDATSCHSLDVSDYQQSEIICNLNYPLSLQYTGQYDVVFDAGTLEHLSNLPMALTNIFGLLMKDGIYYFGLPCNNWPDHGFFQFSPTFFRDLCIDNSELNLVSLYLYTSKKCYDYNSINQYVKTAIFSSGRKLMVEGIIKKQGDFNNFDLTQTKYRQLYSAKKSVASLDEVLVPIFSLRRIASVVLSKFSVSPFIPLGLKEFILNYLFKFRSARF